MARVFVSHASEDTAFATDVGEWLRDQGHSIFLDSDVDAGLRVGDVWKQELFRQVSSADAVVCVVSDRFNRSPWCAAEVTIAETAGVRLLPIQLSGATSPLLDHRQYVSTDDASWRDRLARSLRWVDTVAGSGSAGEGAAFPGLAPFVMGMRRYFLGRTDEAHRLVRKLCSLEDRAAGGLLLVVGPSGCGKSSLVRAGVAAALADDDPAWEVVPPFTPGRDPVGALHRALVDVAEASGLDRTAAEIAAALEADDGLARLADELLVAGPGPHRRQLLVVIDQGDELVTPGAEPTDSARLLRLVRRALDGPVRVVMTLRSELQDRLLALPELADVPIDVQPLRPLAPDALHVVVEEPAKRADLEIDPALVARLVADTGDGEALPLLAFTLQQLTEGLERGSEIQATRYDEIGGVRGALSKHADQALVDAARASGLEPDQVLDGLVRLATVDPSGDRVRRRVDLARQPEGLRTALGVFVERRLLTTTSEGGSAWVAVTHEALFSAWAPLDGAIGARAEALDAARSVHQAGTEWRAGDRCDRFLWSDERLVVTLTSLGYEPTVHGPLRRADIGDLAADALVDGDGLDFLLAARAHVDAGRRRRRRRLRAPSSSSPASWRCSWPRARSPSCSARDSESQRRLATGRSLLSQAEAARDRQAGVALQLGVAALAVAPSTETRASLVSTLIGNRYVTTVARNGPGTPDDAVPVTVSSIAFSPDRRTMAADTLLQPGDTVTRHPTYGVRLWDVRDRAHPEPLSTIEHASAAWALAFSADGTMLALGGPFGTLALWDVSDPAEPVRLSSIVIAPVDMWITSVAFSSDGRTVLIGDWDNFGDRRDKATLWDISTPERPRHLATLPGGTGAVHDVALRDDGRTAAVAEDDGTVVLWDLATPTAPPAHHARRPHELGLDGRLQPGRTPPGHRGRRPQRDPVGRR